MEWGDIIFHGIVAVVIVGIMLLFDMNPIGAAVLNGVMWGVREFAQDWEKGYRPPYIWPIRRSTQKDLEFVVPLVVGFIVAFMAVLG